MFARLNSTSRPQPTTVRAREPARTRISTQKTRYLAISLILTVALIAFEIFNFDTTQYALTDLLGDISFAGVKWAAILAIAFCGIDFAGLLRVFTPDEDGSTPKEVGYLMAAWLLGATMNAVMTWYAVSITLLGHDIGNEVISREQLLHVVPIFVAVLVWLTRILFIGALSIAGDHLWQKATTDVRPVQRPKRVVRNAHGEQLIMRPREQDAVPTFVPQAQANQTEARLP